MSLLDLWEGDTLPAWEARWGVPRFEAHDALDSTNDRARALAEAGGEPFTVVLAESQSAGRGREGRPWASPAGSGLWVSVLAPWAPVEARSLLPLRTGLATCRAVEGAALGVRAGLKWPNDVLIAGRKVSGILCEGVPAGVIVGIGINVRAGALPPELVERAVALDEHASDRVDRGALLGRLLGELRGLLSPPSLRIEGELARELDARDVLRGRAVIAAAGEEGVARGIDARGALRVEVEGGEVRRVVAGGVRVREN